MPRPVGDFQKPMKRPNMCSLLVSIGAILILVTPPRTPDVNPSSDVAYDAIVAEIAVVQGLINVAEGRLVELTRRGLEVGVSGGTCLTPVKWLAWRAGIAPERAYGMVRLAERAEELPRTLAALAAGELTVDQATEVARHVPARYDESAARVASCCTVKQLRQALPCYRDPKPDDGSGSDERRSVSTRVDEHGWWGRFRLPEAEGAIVDQALKAMYEDLKRQARRDAPDGVDPEPVNAADALVALAKTALQAGEAARPGTDRYLVHAHLEAGAHGVQLMTHLGIVVPDNQRRQILCDTRLRGIVHDGIAPVGIGHTTRIVNRRLRRAIEHRDRGCAVPGCGRTTNLDIHHIWHWEDGGPTETPNLITLCKHHHTCHHNGTLGITGNADLPRHVEPGVVFTNPRGHPLGPVGHPTPPAPGTDLPDAARAIGIEPHRYQPPTGERLDRWGFHLQSELPEPLITRSSQGPTPTPTKPHHAAPRRAPRRAASSIDAMFQLDVPGEEATA